MPFEITFIWTGEWAWWFTVMMAIVVPALGLGLVVLYDRALHYMSGKDEWPGWPMLGFDAFLDWVQKFRLWDVLKRRLGNRIMGCVLSLFVLYPAMFLAVMVIPLWFAVMSVGVVVEAAIGESLGQAVRRARRRREASLFAPPST